MPVKRNNPKKNCRDQITESDDKSEDGNNDKDLLDSISKEKVLADNLDTKKDMNMDEKKKAKKQIRTMLHIGERP